MYINKFNKQFFFDFYPIILNNDNILNLIYAYKKEYKMDNQEDILDKFKAGLNRGLRIVNVRSKEAYDVLKAKNNIQGKNRNKRKLVEELGNAVYRTYKHKGNISEDSIKNKCEDILKVETEIDDLNEQIQNIHENALKELGKLKAITKPNDDGSDSKE